MIKPSSDYPQNEADNQSGERHTPHERQHASAQELSAEERREKFKAALADTMEKYDWALRKLAE